METIDGRELVDAQRLLQQVLGLCVDTRVDVFIRLALGMRSAFPLQIFVAMFAGMCADVYEGTCADIPSDKRVSMCVGMRLGMCAGMCVGLCVRM